MGKEILHPGRLGQVAAMSDGERSEVDDRVADVREMSRFKVRLTRREVLSRVRGCSGMAVYRMTQRQPGLRSLASRPWLY